MNIFAFAIGFLTGSVVAATGIGGGVFLMPMLILLLHIAPVDAVGTSLLFMSVTKLLATLLHWKQKTVDFGLAVRLAVGSVPGALVGSALIGFLHSRLGQGVNHFLRIAIGVSLILIAAVSLIMDALKNHYSLASGVASRPEGHDLRNAIWIGLVGGLLVGVTSVGSGSLIIILLLIFCPRAPVVLVGTDIFHGLILATVAALAHLGIGHTDLRLVGLLLIGSVGGVLLGTRISIGLGPLWLRRALLVLAAAGGIAMF